MKIKNLDELQYIKRGRIFKHCLFTIIGLLLVYIALLQVDIVLTDHQTALLLIIIFVVSLFCIEMIFYDIYPLSESRQKYLYFVMGLLGLVIIILAAYELITGETDFIENGILSNVGAGIITGSLFLLILLAYLVKKFFNRMNGGES